MPDSAAGEARTGELMREIGKVLLAHVSKHPALDAADVATDLSVATKLAAVAVDYASGEQETVALEQYAVTLTADDSDLDKLATDIVDALKARELDA